MSRRRAAIAVGDDAANAVPRQRPRLMTDHGYDSFDDEEEDRRMGELSAASLATENARLKAQVAQLQEKLERTTEDRDMWRNAAAAQRASAEERLEAFRREHQERVRLEGEVSQLGAESKARDYTIGQLEAKLQEDDSLIDLLNAKLAREYEKSRELECKRWFPPPATGIHGICKCLLSVATHFDAAPDGTVYARAAEPPHGCHHYFVLNVRDKYDDGDAWWHTGNGAWTVAYHGTTLESVQQIVRNGFHMSKAQRAAYGHGIYCTPDPDTARKYAKPFTHEGTNCRAVLQCFVDPREKQLGRPANNTHGEYWLIPGGYAIRPYAVCIYRGS